MEPKNAGDKRLMSVLQALSLEVDQHLGTMVDMPAQESMILSWMKALLSGKGDSKEVRIWLDLD